MAHEGAYEPHPAPPSGPPELPQGVTSFPRWPAWYGPAALVGGFVIAIVAYLIVKSVAVHPTGKQHVTEDLGAKGSQLAIAAAAFAVIVVAPVCEELFFRGFFYRALRTRMGVATAAILDGLVFGVIHYGGSDTVQILP